MEGSCRHCGERLRPTQYRSRYCANSCRQKAYRARKNPLPTELTCRDRWVRWEPQKRGGRVAKVPMTVDGRHASVTDPGTWGTYEAVSRRAPGRRIGIVLGDGLGCIDLDHCVEGGVLAPWAQGIIAQHRPDAVLVELSPSGTGVHIFLPMPEAPGRRIREGDVNLEIYSRDRYMTVTGKQI